MLEDFGNIFDKVAADIDSAVINKCVSKIDDHVFYQTCFFPAVAITLLFGFTKKRRKLLLSCLGVRPCLVFPMDVFTRSSRISYACAFGATGFLVYELTLEGQQLFNIPINNKTEESFLAIVSVLMYGMVFFPVFACLTLSSVFDLALGALYVWMLLGVQIYKLTECEIVWQSRLFLVLQRLPSLLCLLYLSISIPNRCLVSISERRFFAWKQTDNSLTKIRESYNGHHVKNLFRKPKVKRNVTGKAAAIKRLVFRFIYPAKKVSIELGAFLFTFLNIIEDYTIRTGLQIAVIFPLEIASVFCVFNVLHSLTSYRTNLLALYRGDHSHIPPPDPGSSVSYCVNIIQYGGFQVGYILWAFVVHWIILTVICLVVMALCIGANYAWLLSLLEYLWPIVLMIVVAKVTQIQPRLAKFVFLKNRGDNLKLKNRPCYFIFVYMFFYNIVLGVGSCLMRILKAIVLGVAFLGRLDISTLSRRFEFWDPGFSAYRGFMLVEYAHTHPVVIVFVRLVIHTWEAAKGTKTPTNHSPEAPSGALVLNISLDDISALNNDKRRRSMKARCNWHVAYTLLHNPALRVTRKGFMQLLRQARELGLRIPVSDNQADIDTGLLAQQVMQAREEGQAPEDK